METPKPPPPRWRPRPEVLTRWIKAAPTAQAKLHRSALADYLTRTAEVEDTDTLKRGEAWILSRVVAEETGIPPSTARRLLAHLVEWANREVSGEVSGPGGVLKLYNSTLYDAGAVRSERGGEHSPAGAEEAASLLPGFEPSAEAIKFNRACEEIRRVRTKARGPGSVRPLPDDLAETFDREARKKWPRITDWAAEIRRFREYWSTPDTQKGLKTFDFWLRFSRWLDKAVAGFEEKRPDGPARRRPWGGLPPSGRPQRYIEDFEPGGKFYDKTLAHTEESTQTD